MDGKKGYFTLVLHSHLPYVRMAGRWPHGEEMVHEALAETYIPLLNALYDLKAEGVEPRLTIGLTPILVEQISDPAVLEHFELYLQERIELAREEVERHPDGHLNYLANFYLDWYNNVAASFQDRYARDVVAAFRRLQDEGNLDIITSAATHGYLPLLERDSSIYAQLKTGVASYTRRFGRAPQGIWLPECGYRPAYVREDGRPYVKPGIEQFLADLNLLYFFTDTHVIEGSRVRQAAGGGDAIAVGAATENVVGPYGAIPVRRAPEVIDRRPEPRLEDKTTMRPHYVRGSKVAVYGRDSRTGMQVWSAAQGYPGDFLYREFHRKDDNSGLQYWRITGAGVDLGEKQLYDPYPAFAKVKDHAAHFSQLVHERVREHAATHTVPGVVISAYDTELFGHWWFEGIAWLKEVLRNLAQSEEVGLITADDYLRQFPPEDAFDIPESSWGAGGGHWTWMNPQTEWIWPLIHAAERQVERLVEQYPAAEAEMARLLDQIAREALLLESSDWPFLISTGQAKEYASNRFQRHMARFNRLAQIAESGRLTEQNMRFVAMVEEVDNPFTAIDYRVFAPREPLPE
ncbi:MAG: glycoside hydrolase family 57 protein [Chloroflexota bacterium]